MQGQICNLKSSFCLLLGEQTVTLTLGLSAALSVRQRTSHTEGAVLVSLGALPPPRLCPP